MGHKTEIIGGGSTAVALWTAYIRETEGLFDHILCMLVQTWAHLPSKKVAPAKEQARKVLFMPDSLSGRSPGLEILVQLIHPCIDKSVQSEEPAPQVQSPKTARPRPGERAGQQGQAGPPPGGAAEFRSGLLAGSIANGTCYLGQVLQTGNVKLEFRKDLDNGKVKQGEHNTAELARAKNKFN